MGTIKITQKYYQCLALVLTFGGVSLSQCRGDTLRFDQLAGRPLVSYAPS